MELQDINNVEGMTCMNIVLPKGGSLEVNVTEKFLEVVRMHFELPPNGNVSEDHVRMYIYGAFKNAVDKAERGE